MITKKELEETLAFQESLNERFKCIEEKGREHFRICLKHRMLNIENVSCIDISLEGNQLSYRFTYRYGSRYCAYEDEKITIPFDYFEKTPEELDKFLTDIKSEEIKNKKEKEKEDRKKYKAELAAKEYQTYKELKAKYENV